MRESFYYYLVIFKNVVTNLINNFALFKRKKNTIF